PMGSQIQESRSAAAWRLARGQHGVLTRRELLGLGFSPGAIKHRVTTGRLHPVATGVYAVGRPELTREGRWMAAVRACGETAVLSHGSAAALWGIGMERRGGIDVSIRRRSDLRRPGIRVHTRIGLPPGDDTTHLRVPVTTVVR